MERAVPAKSEREENRKYYKTVRKKEKTVIKKKKCYKQREK